VSRVGGNAQIKAMRQVAGRLRLDLAQYRELAAFAQFASDLDKATRDQLTRGEKLTEILKQPQFAPLAVERQVAIIWTGTNGYLDDVPTPKIAEFETGLYRYLDQNHPKLLPAIAKAKEISDATTAALREAVVAYRHEAGYETAESKGAADAAPIKDAAPSKDAAETKEPAETKDETTAAASDKRVAASKSAATKASAPKKAARRKKAKAG
jgi:F-type H+-transporting ATPase subunit alpha